VIVIPERDVPGINASAWAHPITMPCPQPILSSGSPTPPGAPRARRSAAHITSAHAPVEMAIARGHLRCSSMSLPKSTPASAPGSVATTTIAPSPRESDELAPEVGEERHERAEMHDRVEGQTLVGPAEDVRDQDQMAGGGHGEELR